MANQPYIPRPYVGQKEDVFRGLLSNDMQLVFRSLNDINSAFKESSNIGVVASEYTFATLPSGTFGKMVIITDSPVNTWGAAVTTGGGSFKVLAWYNDTNWTVLGI